MLVSKVSPNVGCQHYSVTTKLGWTADVTRCERPRQGGEEKLLQKKENDGSNYKTVDVKKITSKVIFWKVRRVTWTRIGGDKLATYYRKGFHKMQ